jgi:hypothetical protein
MNCKVSKRQRKRYNLHYRIRKQGYRLSTKECTIYIPTGTEISKQVSVLKNMFDYSLQLDFKY